MRTAVVVLLALAVSGCLEGGAPATGDPVADEPPSSAPATPIPSAPGSMHDVAIRPLAAGQQGGVHEAERAVLRTAAEYQSFWARVREDDTQPPPPVAFSSSTVVGVALGQRPDACWSVRITGATQRDGVTTVEVTTFAPAPGLACASVVTYPWHLVALDGPDREVEFVQVQSTGPLPPSPTPPPTPTPVTPSGPHDVAFRRIETGQQTSLQEEKVGYVTSAAEWSRFWSTHSQGTAPTVDFSRETVAYVFAGERSNTCWAVRASEAVDDGAGFTTLRYTLYQPGPNMMCGDAITYPYDIVALEGAGRTVGFTEQKATSPPPS